MKYDNKIIVVIIMRSECNPKVVHYTEVKEEPVPSDMAERTTIRWLIAEKDGAENFYMRLFKMDKNAHINAHFHPWEHEIFVIKGTGRVRIGSKTYEVKEGMAIYIPPNVEHEYWSLEELMFLCIIPAKPTAPKTDAPIEC